MSIQNNGATIHKIQNDSCRYAQSVESFRFNRGQPSKYQVTFFIEQTMYGAVYLGLAPKMSIMKGDHYKDRNMFMAGGPGQAFQNGKSKIYPLSCKTGDIVAMCFDLAAGELRYELNGSDCGLCIKDDQLAKDVLHATIELHDEEDKVMIMDPAGLLPKDGAPVAASAPAPVYADAAPVTAVPVQMSGGAAGPMSGLTVAQPVVGFDAELNGLMA